MYISKIYRSIDKYLRFLYFDNSKRVKATDILILCNNEYNL